MSWLFSRALVEEYLVDTCSDGAPFAPLSGNPTPQAYLPPDKMTAFSRLSRFGMTFAPLMADRGAALLTWYLAGFPAKTSVRLEKASASMASDPDCGQKWRELSVKYNPSSSSWKTHRCLWDEDLPEFSVILPRWGSMRAGVLSERMTLALHTAETDAGLLPTPLASNTKAHHMRSGGRPARSYFTTPTSRSPGDCAAERNRNTPSLAAQVNMYPTHWPTPKANDAQKRGNFDATNPRNGLPAAAKLWPTPLCPRRNDSENTAGRYYPTQKQHDLTAAVACDGGQLNPNFVEWLMGWPYDYTRIDKRRTPFPREEITGECLRIVWDDQRFTGTPQGQDFIAQLSREYPDLVCELSRGSALGRGQASMESLSTVLRGLWEACRSWPLRNTQESFQTAWECAASETQGWIAMASVRGIWHAEWPGVPRVETGVIARVDRLKAIGNGQVPQCAAEAYRQLSKR